MDDYSIKVIPLGGVGEIGKNMMLIEINNRILIIDCGVLFPEEDLLGIDLVIPDVSYLVANRDRIDGMVLTHGHEDHIGALPYVLPKVDFPIYGTKLTLGLVKAKLQDNNYLEDLDLVEVAPGEKINIGSFLVEWFRVNHSIADTCGLAVHTDLGAIVYASDFKFDQTPVDGIVADFNRLANLGKEGTLALFSDSTNAEKEGYTLSEKVVGDRIENVFASAEGRIIVATFASNIHRIQQVIDSAVKYKRRIAIAGRSMINNTQIASELGYLDIPEDVLVELKDVQHLAAEKVVLLTTGSQGEPMAALTRMASGEHRQINVQDGDTVLVSASPIPGNERLVGETINKLFRLGAEVVYQAISSVHVSGHASREELKLICNLVQPKYFIPVHGEYRHLFHHAELAHSLGISKTNIFTLEPGAILELTANEGRINGNIGVDRVLIDGLGIGDVGNVVLRERKLLSQDGILVVVLTLAHEEGRLLAGPDILSKGFVYIKEAEELMEQLKEIAQRAVQKCENEGITQWSTIKNRLRNALSGYIYQRIKRRPVIMPIIMEVEP